MEKPVTFQNCGQQLVGMLHVPDRLNAEERAPAVAMFHGFTGHKSEAHRLFVKVARSLCKAGFVVLRFDFRGSGDSEGDFEDVTVPGEVSDAKRSIGFLAEQPWVDKEKIGVIGLSLGGRVAAILSSKDERVKFVVLYSPALGPLRDRFISQLSDEALKKLTSGQAVKVSEGWYLKKRFFDTLDSPVPLDVMDGIKVPILIVHGSKDEVVPDETSRRAYQIVKDLNEKNDLYIVEGGDHTFSKREHTSEVIDKTLRWLHSLQLALPK